MITESEQAVSSKPGDLEEGIEAKTAKTSKDGGGKTRVDWRSVAVFRTVGLGPWGVVGFAAAVGDGDWLGLRLGGGWWGVWLRL